MLPRGHHRWQGPRARQCLALARGRFRVLVGDEIAAMEDPDPEALAAQMKRVADESKE